MKITRWEVCVWIVPSQYQIVPSVALHRWCHLGSQRIKRAKILWKGQQALWEWLEMSYHVRWNWVKVWFWVTWPFHEQWVLLPSSWLYSLIPLSHWLWSLSLLPVSSSSSLSLEKLQSELYLPACSVICARLVKWWKGVARRTSEPSQDKNRGAGEWCGEEREDGENHSVDTNVLTMSC